MNHSRSSQIGGRTASLLMIGLVSVLSACASLDIGKASRGIDRGMTEQEVVAAIGRQPDSVSLTNCGTSALDPSQCRQYAYRSHGLSLLVLFNEECDGSWTVSSWSVDRSHQRS
jgi:hypothetical protein